ncbi:MAG: hypothetical protein JST51_01565 [Armatimonadetes bacterium]|nr:hypothetical protein [Armatimonadota bacterium]
MFGVWGVGMIPDWTETPTEEGFYVIAKVNVMTSFGKPFTRQLKRIDGVLSYPRSLLSVGDDEWAPIEELKGFDFYGPIPMKVAA